MGFLSKFIGATVKTVLTPVAVAKDAVNVAVGIEPNETKELVESAIKDVKEATDNLVDGEL